MFNPPGADLAMAARQAGDLARDRQDWPAAERHYRLHLLGAPDDAAIWVQLGHALKEQGFFLPAEDAYRTALRSIPDDADLHLQLGHLLKLAGRGAEAALAYRQSLRCAPLRAAHDELLALGDGPAAARLLEEWGAAAQPATGLTWLEVTDLVHYLRQHATVSGIQRVQLALLEQLFPHTASASAANPSGPGVEGFSVVMRAADGRSFWELPVEMLCGLIRLLAEPEVSHAAVQAVLARMEAAASLARPVAGDSWMVLGAFWVGGDVATAYAGLKAQGLRIGVLLYDLIPLTHPEFCDSRLVYEFTLALADGLRCFDFILAISAYTAREIHRWIAAEGLPEIPIRVLPLGHGLRSVPAGLPELPALAHGAGSRLWAGLWRGPLAALRGRDFALCVCTIEARKNHLYLLNLWKQLLAEGIAVPDLVLVGRMGWRVADFTAQLAASGNLQGRVHLLHDLSDAALEALYAACRFTLFPSFVEGWGLPVGESLARGKLCIAADTSAIREVGGDFALYLDPHNLHSGLELLRGLLADPALLAEHEARLKRDFAPRSWRIVAEDFRDALAEMLQQPARIAGRPMGDLPAGAIFRPGLLADPQRPLGDYSRHASRLILAEGWRMEAAQAARMVAEEAALSFAVSAQPGVEIIVFCGFELGVTPAIAGLVASQHTSLGCLKLLPEEGEARSLLLPPAATGGEASSAGVSSCATHHPMLMPVRLPMRVAADGGVRLRLHWEGAPGSVLLRSLAWCPVADLPARQELVEALLLDQPR